MGVGVVIQRDETFTHQVVERRAHIAKVFLQRVMIFDLVVGDDTFVDLQRGITYLYKLSV